MSDDKSLIKIEDIAGLSKPATLLIEKISDAIGGIAKPFQIKRVAQAEADAEIIKTQAQIQITEIHHRAAARFLTEEAKKQENIESITEKALPRLKDSSNPQQMEDDWVTNFFDKCRIISDEQMQSLWAKVLSGEANAPGSFSKRTVNFLGSLDKNDALLFTSLCRFNWLLGTIDPIIFDPEDPIYGKHGINFDRLRHLDAVGLVNFEPIGGYRRVRIPAIYIASYFGNLIFMEFKKKENNELSLGKVLLTNIGRELCRVCESTPAEGFIEYVLNKWIAQGIIVFSPYPRVSLPF